MLLQKRVVREPHSAAGTLSDSEREAHAAAALDETDAIPGLSDGIEDEQAGHDDTCTLSAVMSSSFKPMFMPDPEGSVKMTVKQISPSVLLPRALTLADFRKCIRSSQPTLMSKYVDTYEMFSSQIGQFSGSSTDYSSLYA